MFYLLGSFPDACSASRQVHVSISSFWPWIRFQTLMFGASSLIPRRRFLGSQGNFQNKGTGQEVSAMVLVVLFVLCSFREVLVAFLEK